MRKVVVILLVSLLCLMSYRTEAQNINVVSSTLSNIGDKAANMLYDRLNQVVTLNGLASTDISNKFLLIPYVTVVTVEETTTVPVNYIAEVEVALYLVDNTKKLVMSQEILTKKGVAENESKAVVEAIKSIKPRDPKLKKMIVVGKDKILDYYNAECDKVMETINTYLEMEMFDEALNELNAIPQVDAELECYKNSIDILSKISAEQQSMSNNNIKNESPDTSWINE